MADLDWRTRLEEFLKEDVEKSQIQIVLNWTEVDEDGRVVTGTEYASGASTDEKD